MIRLTNADTFKSNKNDRILTVSMMNEDQRLHISTGVKEDTNMDTKLKNYIHPNRTSANQWHNITVKQVFGRGEFMLEIILDGELVHKRPLKHTPLTYRNVKVIVGDKHPPMIKGWIDKVNIETGNLMSRRFKWEF